jgi:hypothetical protein
VTGLAKGDDVSPEDCARTLCANGRDAINARAVLLFMDFIYVAKIAVKEAPQHVTQT